MIDLFQSKAVRVDVASGDQLDVRSFAVRQRMNELDRVDLRVVSPNGSVALSEVIGREATVRLDAGSWSRTYTGVCVEMEQVRVDEGNLATYTLAVAPRAWLLTQRKNYRIFQFLSELDIVKKLLGEWGIEHEARISRTHKPRKYRVQYDEADWAFLCRMLEDAGISFFFEAADGGTKLVLDDEPQSRDVGFPMLQFHDSPGPTDAPFVTRVSIVQSVRPGAMTIGDLDYRKPSKAQPRLDATGGLPQESRLEQFDYEPGAFLFQGGGGGNTPTADDRGASRTDEAAGRERTEGRLLSRRLGDKVIRFVSNVLALSPGDILTVARHPHRVLSPESRLLVTGSVLAGDHDSDWRVHVDSASAAVPRRPAHVTPKPRVRGIESATVVGPSGEEIHTDEYGRVRVHFHWDRESKRDEQSSCWLPTSQPWAGTGFGGVNLPRIGQEVMVEFLGGDPDRPVVIGRVYTETNPPPDKLPRFKEVSGLFSESTPRMVMGAADGGGATGGQSLLGGGTPMSSSEINGMVTQPGAFQAASPTGINHGWNGSGIKMEDSYGKEILYLQAQKDMNLVVNNCWRTVVRNNRACQVGTDDQLEVGHRSNTEIKENQNVKIGTDQFLVVKGKRMEDVRGTFTQLVGADGIQVKSTSETITIATRGYSQVLMVESEEKIELVVGSSTIVITADSIKIQATKTGIQPAQGGGA
jgi:type VI secretion system secreted protein VgrG